MSLAAIDLQFTYEKYVSVNIAYGFRGGQGTCSGSRILDGGFSTAAAQTELSVFNKSHCEILDLLQQKGTVYDKAFMTKERYSEGSDEASRVIVEFPVKYTHVISRYG